MGLPIVNQSYHADGRALWVTKKRKRQEVDKSSFTNTLTFLMSSDIFTIYVPRAFQPIFSNPLILQHARKAIQSVRLGRFIAIFDIRICRSSHKLWISEVVGIPRAPRGAPTKKRRNYFALRCERFPSFKTGLTTLLSIGFPTGRI